MGSTRIALLAAVFALLSFGAFMQAGIVAPGEVARWLHLIVLSAGTVAMLAVSRLDCRLICRHAAKLLLCSVLLLLILHCAGGVPRDLQPSAVVTLAVILFLAAGPARTHLKKSVPIWVLVGVWIGTAVLIISTSDVSQGLLLLLAGLLVLAVRGHGRKASLAAVAVSCALLYAALQNPNRLMRCIDFFLDREGPRCLPLYKVALEAGGWMGVGLGRGEAMQRFPGAEQEFMVAHIGEELGRVGIIGLLVLYILLAIAALGASLRAQDLCARCLGLGMTALLVLPVFLHVGVVFEWMPLRTLPLPFVTGTWMQQLVPFAALGILLNIAGQSGDAAG